MLKRRRGACMKANGIRIHLSNASVAGTFERWIEAGEAGTERSDTDAVLISFPAFEQECFKSPADLKKICKHLSLPAGGFEITLGLYKRHEEFVVPPLIELIVNVDVEFYICAEAWKSSKLYLF